MIYLDYNATHPPLQDIFEKNWKRYLQNPANPSGISVASQKNQAFIDKKRKSISDALGWKPDSVKFASTGTEATYWLVKSFAARRPEASHCILSSCEHDAMIAACQDAGLKIVYLPVTRQGLTDPAELAKLLQSGKLESGNLQPHSVAFASIIHASNETGVIQPVEKLSAICRSYEIPFLSDCIQSAGKIPLPMEWLDGLLLNGHKLGAGAGTSVAAFAPMYVDDIASLYRGGLQEEETRAGTENLLSIASMADAFRFQLENMEEKTLRLSPLHADLEGFLKDRGVTIAGEDSPRLSNTTYAVFSNVEHMDFLLMGLDQAGIVCSTGSSCKSRTRQPSRILLKMRFSEKESMQALRFSSGINTTGSDFETLKETLAPILERLTRSSATST